MLAFFVLFALIVLLIVLLGVAYRSEGNTSDEPEPDRRLDKLVTVLETDVMEGVIQRARIEACSEIEALNRLIRAGLESPPRS